MRPVFTFVNRVPRGFNPRTRKGCDCLADSISSSAFCFNPRTRKGCDTATFAQFRNKVCFNPRTRKGCDKCAMAAAISLVEFQSTHP